jgi:hypothetical protein
MVKGNPSNRLSCKHCILYRTKWFDLHTLVVNLVKNLVEWYLLNSHSSATWKCRGVAQWRQNLETNKSSFYMAF